MCLYVGSEVILANILEKKQGVTIKDIDLYCKNLMLEFELKNLSKMYTLA